MSINRRVLFIGGYDPKSSKRVYHEQKKQIDLYVARFEKNLVIGDIQKSSAIRSSWQIHNKKENVQTHFDLLQWDDLVRQRWARKDRDLVLEAIASWYEFVTTGQILQMWRMSRPLVYASQLPYALATLTIVLPLLLGWLATVVLQFVVPQGGVEWGWSVGAFLSAVAFVLAYQGLRKIQATWFLRVVAFARHYAREVNSTHESSFYRARISAWAKDLRAELVNSTSDEILIVGYSAGSILATGLVTELNKHLSPKQSSKLALLTLGNCIPVAACLPTAQALRRDLDSIVQQNTFWLDVTSPADWGSIYGVDTAKLYAQAPSSPRRLQISPRFHTLFSPTSYEALRKDKYRVHQQYLCCTEILGESPLSYDYLGLLSGTLTLQQRNNTKLS